MFKPLGVAFTLCILNLLAESSFYNLSSVFQLTENNFNEVVHCLDGSRCPAGHLVQFYHSGSGISKEFSEVYLNASTIAHYWAGQVLNLAVVDCNYYLDLCLKHGFRRIPVLKYFKRQSPPGNLGETIPTYLNATYLLRQIVKRINDEYCQKSYKDWPNFDKMPDVADISDIWTEEYKCITQILLVPVENMTDPAGVTDLVNIHRYTKGTVPVQRILSNHTIVTIQELKSESFFPFMYKRSNFTANETECLAIDDPSRSTPTYTEIFANYGLEFNFQKKIQTTRYYGREGEEFIIERYNKKRGH